jgi:hypothetical protein
MEAIGYTSRRTVAEEETRFLLEDDCLRVEAGSGTIRFPLVGVSEIRLHYQPNRYEKDVYECAIFAGTGCFRIFSRYVAGPLDFRDQGEAYRLFVTELCRRCAAAGPVRLACGVTGGRFAGNLIACGAGLGLLFFALGLVPVTAFVGFRLTILAPMLLFGGLWFLRNRPSRFTADAIPARVLPRGEAAR